MFDKIIPDDPNSIKTNNNKLNYFTINTNKLLFKIPKNIDKNSFL